MIKEKELEKLRNTIRYPQGEGITLQYIQNRLKAKADEYQLDVDFYYDQITSGLVGTVVNKVAGGKMQDCIVLFHPSHKKDYTKIVFAVGHQGTMAFVETYAYGMSKNFSKMNRRSAAGKDLKETIFNPDANASAKAMGRLVVNGFMSLGGSKAKLQQEEYWYGGVMEIINEAISAVS